MFMLTKLLDYKVGVLSITLRSLWGARFNKADATGAGNCEVDSVKDNSKPKTEARTMKIVTNTYTS